MKNLLPAIFILLVILDCSCNTTEPQKTIIQSVELFEQDVSVSEVYLGIKVQIPQKNQQVVLFRDDIEILRFSATKPDTIIIDTSRPELTNYRYRAQLVQSDFVIGISEEISVQTLEPTSHNILWKIYEFDSPGGTGEFTDVTIINENDIWVCGEMWVADSNNSTNYIKKNVGHWNGVKWELEAVNFKYFYGQGPSKSTSVLGFSSNDILLSSGSSVMHFNGSTWNSLKYLSSINYTIGSVSKMTGASSNDFYCSGYGNSLIHWNGSSWSKIDPGISTDIVDILLVDKLEDILYLSTFKFDQTQNLLTTNLVRLKSKNLTNNYDIPLQEGPFAVWTNREFPIYTASNRVYSNKFGFWAEEIGPPQVSYRKIVGNGNNDIFAVGQYTSHFNGKDWKIYPEIFDPSIILKSVDFKENTITIVGMKNGHPVAILGFRT